MTGKTILLVFLVSLFCLASSTVKLRELYSWNVLDWNYPDEYTKQQARRTGALIPENALPVGIERWREKLFVSVPRWRAGIPATLNYIDLSAPYDPSPKLTPYPSYAGNELGNCETGLNTVYRIKADKCDRLWVLDVGTYGYDPNVTNVCPYTLNVYDLKTDLRIRKYVFRPEDIVATTFIANIALDIGSSCEDTFAYFSDELGYGLISYSWQQNKSWRFSHSFFMPDPLVGDFNIAGLNFQWGAEGIFGITASPIGPDGYRTLYFSPLSSFTEFSVSTRILRNETSVKGSYRDFNVVGSRGPDTHTTAKVMDDSGVQLYSLIDQNAIGCWSSALPYKPQNLGIVDKDDVRLIFPSDVKIDNDKNVWVISERMPVFLEAELDYSDINFRIFSAPLSTLIEGTVCEAPKPYRMPVQAYQSPFSKKPKSLYSPGSPVTTISPNYYVSPSAAPQINNRYNAQLQNTIPQVTSPSYFGFPNQQSIRYVVGQNNLDQNQQNQPWWLTPPQYDVQE